MKIKLLKLAIVLMLLYITAAISAIIYGAVVGTSSDERYFKRFPSEISEYSLVKNNKPCGLNICITSTFGNKFEFSGKFTRPVLESVDDKAIKCQLKK